MSGPIRLPGSVFWPSVPPPVNEELVYARHDRGFALYSMRSADVSRNYIQCQPDEDLDAWSGPTNMARVADAPWARLWTTSSKSGPVLEKSVTPMRSFIAEPMRYGQLFLAGDAAHIVPPTGAKGLNLAVSDIHYLSAGLQRNSMATAISDLLDAYSDTALRRVWKTQRFLVVDDIIAAPLHVRVMHSMIAFGQADLAYVLESRAAQTMLAENYVGLPY